MLSVEETIERWVKAKNPRRILDLHGRSFDTFPILPDDVEYLNIMHTDIMDIKILPKSLKWLHCKYSTVTSIDTVLPPNLKYLNVRRCEYLSLFEVPKNIKFISDIHIYIQNNRFTEEYESDVSEHYKYAMKRIDEWKIENINKNKNKNKKPLDLSWLRIQDYSIIPEEVEYLITSGNRILISLQTLPKGLKRLEYDLFPFNSLDGLPNNLEYLEIKRSNIDVIDKLPNTIKKLYIKGNSHNLIIKSLPLELKDLKIICYEESRIECNFPLKLRKIYLKLYKLNSSIPLFPESLHFIDLSFTLVPPIHLIIL